MVRTIVTPALTLGAVLALSGAATAADDGPAKSGIAGFTMTLGGKGTAAQAAADDDTELTHGYRRGGYYGGYRNYYGGYGGGYGGYRSYYGGYGRGFGYGGYGYGYGGYRNYYGGGYYGGYRPYYYSSYSSYYYRPVVSYYGGFGYGYGGGYYCGISGDKNDTSAPVISLGMKVVSNPVAVREPAPASTEPAPAGTFRYDGGPATPPATGLPVSLPKTKPASPYTYKAYGEK